ncbi:hypothetical protein [Flexivirga lutea]
MTTREPDSGSSLRRTWVKRFATLLACWLATWVFASWLQLRPRPIGLLAAAGLLFAVCWWAAERRLDWDPAEWEGDPMGRRMRTGSDSRISYLRRQIEDASVPKDSGANASATGLQGILRDLALDRLRLRAAEGGAAQVPDDAALLAHADPRLAEYLSARPAPPVSRQTVNDIINRIEAL